MTNSELTKAERLAAKEQCENDLGLWERKIRRADPEDILVLELGKMRSQLNMNVAGLEYELCEAEELHPGPEYVDDLKLKLEIAKKKRELFTEEQSPDRDPVRLQKLQDELEQSGAQDSG
jgi:hypothetical protein